MAQRPLLVAALLVLAGCGSLTGVPATGGNGTVTPAPVPTDGPTPRAERADLPGPLAGEVPNTTALARLHAASLERRSYRLRTYVSQSWGSEPNNTVQHHLDQPIYRVGSDGTYRAARVLLVVGSAPTRRRPQWEAYGDGGVEYRRVGSAGGTSYERRQLSSATLPPHQQRAVALLVRYLDVADATVEPVRMDRGPRIRVVGRDPRAPGLGNVSRYSVEAVLTETGRVEEFDASYRAANGSSIRVGFRVRDVGSVRVDTPEWYGEAREATAVDPDGTTTPTPAPDSSDPHPPGQ